MRILIIGATGTIGGAVAAALASGNEIVGVTRNSAPVSVDVGNPDSIRTMFRKIGKVDAVVSAAGDARFKPLNQLTDEDFEYTLHNKLMGQVNLVRYGFDSVNDGGAFTLTSGVLAQSPMPGSAVISLINAGLEGFTRAAALEAPRKIRVNVVSPPWVTETLIALKMDPSHGLPATTVARAYVRSVTGKENGAVIQATA